MTPSDYIQAGYEMSMQKAQPEIDRAEQEVMEAYIKPILPTATIDDCAVRAAVMAFAFLLILQRNIVATRGGARLKTGASSIRPTGEENLQQLAHICHIKLEAVRALTGASKDAQVYDLCQIYFTSNFLYTK